LRVVENDEVWKVGGDADRVGGVCTDKFQGSQCLSSERGEEWEMHEECFTRGCEFGHGKIDRDYEWRELGRRCDRMTDLWSL
jgi:hypothetical protein